MSLVGSEVDVSMEHSLRRPPEASCAVVSDDEHSVPEDDGRRGDPHPPPSPPRAAERLFLSDLVTRSISAAALAQELHRGGAHHRPQQHAASSSLWTGTSVNTGDFASAAGWVTAVDDSDSIFGESLPPISASSDTLTIPFAESDDDDDSNYDNIFKKDVLSRNYDLSEVNEDTFHDSKMATVTPSKAKAPAPTKFFPTEAPTHVDAAEKVYDTAKGVWAWGKGMTVIKPFLGLAEGVAGKVVGIAGSNLSSIDGAVVGQLHSLDDKMLNPAIAAILGAFLGAAGKAEDILKPIIVAILKPLGLIKNSAENPELTTVPGVKVQ